jgi:DNA-binding response OmpR family regulator
MTGPEIVTWVRNKIEHRIPILFVTNRNEERDLVDALSNGVDDYLTKPVRVGELTARVNALMRRSYPASPTEIESFGRYSFDTRRRMLTIEGEPVELKQKEYELAHFLFHNVGRLLARQHLLEKVWGVNPEIWSRSLDTHVSNLRNKLGLRPPSGYRLSAVYGVGYRLESLDESDSVAAGSESAAPSA